MTRSTADGTSHARVRQDPLVATGTEREWRAWVRYLAGAARARLAGSVLLVVGALALAAGALAFFSALASEVVEGETQRVDEAALRWLQQYSSPALDEIARMVSAFGNEVVYILLVVLVAAFALQRRWGAGGSLLIVTLGAQILNNVLKAYYQRTRPSPVTALIHAQTWSFPSGHATIAASFYVFLAYLGWRFLHGLARYVWTVLLVALVLLIDLSRLYLGVHYLTDVVAGNAVGAAWVAAVIAAANVVAGRRR